MLPAVRHLLREEGAQAARAIQRLLPCCDPTWLQGVYTLPCSSALLLQYKDAADRVPCALPTCSRLPANNTPPSQPLNCTLPNR